MKTYGMMVSGLVMTVAAAVVVGQTVDQAKVVNLAELGKVVEENHSRVEKILEDRGIPQLQEKVKQLSEQRGDLRALSGAMRDLARAQRAALSNWDRTVTEENFRALAKIDDLRGGFRGDASKAPGDAEAADAFGGLNAMLDQMAQELEGMDEGPARTRLKERYARYAKSMREVPQIHEQAGNTIVSEALSGLGEKLDAYADGVEEDIFQTEIDRAELVQQVSMLEKIADVIDVLQVGEHLKAGKGPRKSGVLGEDVLGKLVGDLNRKLGASPRSVTSQPAMSNAEIERDIYERTHRPTKPKSASSSANLAKPVPASQPSRSYLERIRPKTVNSTVGQ